MSLGDVLLVRVPLSNSVIQIPYEVGWMLLKERK